MNINQDTLILLVLRESVCWHALACTPSDVRHRSPCRIRRVTAREASGAREGAGRLRGGDVLRRIAPPYPPAYWCTWGGTSVPEKVPADDRTPTVSGPEAERMPTAEEVSTCHTTWAVIPV